MRARLAAATAALLAAALLLPGSGPRGAVQQNVKLTLTKTAPAVVDAGDQFSYVLKLANDGDATLFGIILQDELPDEVTFVSLSTSRLELKCVPPTADRVVRCTIAALKPRDSGSVTIDVRAAVDPPATIQNTARASSKRPTQEASASARTDVAAADLAVTKAGPAQVQVGDVVAYEIAVVNHGKFRAKDASLADSLPDLLEDVSAPGCTVAAGTASCPLGDLGPGEKRTLEVAGRAASEGTAVDKASVSTRTTDTDAGNNTAEATTRIVKKPPPPRTPADLAVTKTVTPLRVRVGGRLTYRIVVANNGPGSASPSVTDRLPSSARFVSATPPCAEQAGFVTCSLGTLESGASAEPIEIVAAALEVGTAVNEASVSGSRDPDTTNNTAQATVTVTTKPPPPRAAPKLTLDPAVGPPGAITHVSGRGFPPQAHVRLRWSKGLGGDDVYADGRGRFPATLLIFDLDVLGPRRLIASPVPGSPSFRRVSAPFLVALRALQPPDFDVR